ncbi:D,D-dipeptide ABC transporter permease, partial [Nonomuraea fuscirosea]
MRRRDPLARKGLLRRLPQAWRQPLAVVGGVLVVAWLVVALAAPVLAPHDPLAQELPRLAAP